MLTITGLFLYPVKSCAGLAVQQAELGDRGFLHDREFLVVDEANVFVTQRTAPELARVRTALDPDGLTLSGPSGARLRLPLCRDDGAPKRTVTIFNDTVVADDCGDEAAEFFSGVLDHPSRLVRVGSVYSRVVPSKAIRAEHRSSGVTPQVPFTDAFPVMLLSEASLADLNARLPKRLPMDRFRPNIVVSGCAPYAENDWSVLRSGNISLLAGATCQRCVITTIDQSVARSDGPEPLRTLATYRRSPDGNGVVFGEYLLLEGRGRLRVGDELVVERTREAAKS